MTQRDKMRELYRRFSGDKKLVVKAYSEAELAGEVNRLRNASGYGTLQYANALWSDGEKKGWLTQNGPFSNSSSGTPTSSPIPILPSSKKSPPSPETAPSDKSSLSASSTTGQTTDTSSLVLAVCNGDTETVRELLAKGANPNGIDEDGDTPLTEAVWQGNQDIAQMLLSAGADHNSQNSAGKSAMEIAVSKGNVEMVRLLQSVAKERILKPKRSVELDNNPELEALMKELRGMVGLNLVKAHVISKIDLLRIQKQKKEAGLPVSPQLLHLAFTGNPGTGKTTVAKLVAKIYKAMGILSKGQLVDVTASKLIGEYVGKTEAKTTEAIEEALGGVLFIDEAHALLDTPHYGMNAIRTLVPALTNYADDLMVIVAGYPEPIKKFIASDPGLKDRFTETIEFEDYLPDELTQVFLKRASDNQVIMAPGTVQKVTSLFEDLYRMRGSDFGNARVAVTRFDKAISNQSSRLARMSSVDRESLMTMRPEDIPTA